MLMLMLMLRLILMAQHKYLLQQNRASVGKCVETAAHSLRHLCQSSEAA